MVRVEPTAEAWLAAIRERIRFGIAMAAMIRMIATTISNSINEKPFSFLFIVFPRSNAPDLCLLYTLAMYALSIAREMPASRSRFTSAALIKILLLFNKIQDNSWSADAWRQR